MGDILWVLTAALGLSLIGSLVVIGMPWGLVLFACASVVLMMRAVACERRTDRTRGADQGQACDDLDEHPPA